MKAINTIFVFTVLFAVFVTGHALADGHKGYAEADGMNGGLLYDNFLKKGNVAPKFDNVYSIDVAPLKKYADFYRCKQCHGWDRIGNKGYYVGRAPKAGKRPNVTGVNLLDNVKEMTPLQVFRKIKNPAVTRPLAYDPSIYDPEVNHEMGDRMPAFGEIFSDSEIWDLVKFLKEDGADFRHYYAMDIKGEYPTAKVSFIDIGKGGSAADGDMIFAENCSSCHGADGTAISIKGKSVGDFTRTKTYELAHKVKFGQPGTDMAPTPLGVKAMNDLHKALTDKMKYPDITK